jgi:hypothetical protein
MPLKTANKTSYKSARRNPKWNAGYYLDSRGYVAVNVGKTHPLADSKGYVRLHTLVWVAAGNARPKLSDRQLLHHINEDKVDNRLENLALLVHDEHADHHSAVAQFRDVQTRLEKDEVPYG